MLFWYCDIVDHTFDTATDTYIFTDLLVDVIVYPDGFVEVVDLDANKILVSYPVSSPKTCWTRPCCVWIVCCS